MQENQQAGAWEAGTPSFGCFSAAIKPIIGVSTVYAQISLSALDIAS
jgi:hypothetical protein